jgi:hypothetical protein
LYERFTLQNGVSNSIEKITMQRHFGELSRQSLESKLVSGIDLVDRYGYQAPFFKKRSKRLSNDLTKLALFALVRKEYGTAKKVVIWSINESRGILNSLIFFTLNILRENSKLMNLLVGILSFIKKKRNKATSNNEN